MPRRKAARAAASDKEANGPRRIDQAGRLIGATATPATSKPQVSEHHCTRTFGARRRHPAGEAGGASFRHARDSSPGDDAARHTTSVADVPGIPTGDRLLITLKARGSEKFDALFDGKLVVQSSRQPICEAARALHDFGYPDELLLVARHQWVNYDAIRGPLGVWRRLRVREDRGGPRFAKWEPFPLRPVLARNGHTEAKAIGHRVGEKNAPAGPPGAGKAHSLPPVAQKGPTSDPGGGNA